MNSINEKRGRVRTLVCVICAAAVLEIVGCKGGAGGTATTEPGAGAAGGDTNSVATNAPAATNAAPSASP